MLLNEALNILTLREKTTEKDRKDKKAFPSDEQAVQAAALIVQNELEKWPVGILEIIGRSHPPREYFLNGASSVIGAYMKIAREKLTLHVQRHIRSLEVDAARNMGPIHARLEDHKWALLAETEERRKVLLQERDELLREAKERIYREYEQQLEGLKSVLTQTSDEMEILKAMIRKQDEEFERRKSSAIGDFQVLESCISEIDADRENVLGHYLMQLVMVEPEALETVSQ